MIRELLAPGSIVLGLRGGFPGALRELLCRSPVPDRAREIGAALTEGGA
jgi:hypothetical protein